MHHQENPISDSTKVVLFDHDDTLVRTIKVKWAQHKYIAQTFYDKKLSNEELRLHWGKPLTLLMKLLYETDNIDMAMSYNIATRDRFPKLLCRNTIKTLKALRESGKKVGLVSSTTRWSLNHDFATLNIPGQLFDYVQTEEDTPFHKPNPCVFDPVMQWIKREKIQPYEVLYVGDHFNDMVAAQKAGFDFIGVGTGLVSVQEFKQFHVNAVPQLLHLLERKNCKASRK
jgi:phosphoglycolate phosphatase-like HAD superfamily hydrolase